MTDQLASELFVFVATDPVARRNYARTIEKEVPLAEIARYKPTAADELRKRGLDAVRCWGSVPGSNNLPSWQRMRPGHRALLYLGDGHFPLLLTVTAKTQSKALAKHLWGEKEKGKTWELMFFFEAAEKIDLDILQARDALGYEPDWWPRGLQYPADENQGALLEKFGSLEAFASSLGAGKDEAPMSADELLRGGKFKGVPPKPPREPRKRKPFDPDEAGRGYLAHEETVQKLLDHVGPSLRKGKKGVNHDGTWTVDGRPCICEIKSITSKNEIHQLQKGLGQILHNCFKTEEHKIKPRAFLIAEREPANSHLWQKLAKRHKVVFTWPERFEKDVPRADS